jgi:hypothetical protein
MKKKLFLMVTLAAMLAFGLMVVGCEYPINWDDPRGFSCGT